ncbi:NAD(P)-dependent alcohol dehydrogenase [Hyphobacterium sp. CCMP332]|nr:NAD(P)-dependent alcohol dehydrogenase [Hyphobacterium sp. CCMP332]
MKAAYYTKYGGPDVLEVREVEKPKPVDDEILVKVKACTVNRTDDHNLSGKPWVMHLTVGMFEPRKKIPGTDFAGVIEESGKNVHGFIPGDRVWGFKDGILSSQAEYFCINPKKNVLKIPENIDFQTAVASAEAAHYAYYFYNKIKNWQDCRIMIHGGTGAIGSALLQMVKYRGAFVCATCRPEHKERVKSLGADQIINYEKEDFTQQDSQYDFVFDAVGKSSFGACNKILKPHGVYASSELGPGNENLYLPLTTALFSKKKVKFPLPFDVNKSLSFVSQILSEGKFNPLIDRVYTLDQIKEAYAYVISGQKVGNVILNMP